MNLRLNKIKNPFVILCKYSLIFAVATSFYVQRIGEGDDLIKLLIPYRSDYAYAFTGLMYILSVITDLFLSENSYQEKKFIFSNYHKLLLLWIISIFLTSLFGSGCLNIGNPKVASVTNVLHLTNSKELAVVSFFVL